MKKTKNLISKKLLIGIAAILLLIATLTGILFGTVRKAHAEDDDDIPVITSFDYRPGEYEITDDGPLHNPYDEFKWSGVPNYTDLLVGGYNYVTVTVKFQMKEKDRGNQDVYLYYDKYSTNYISKLSFDYGGDGATKEYGVVTVEFRSLRIESFIDSYEKLGLVVRYDAHGAGSDTWYNKDCTITVDLDNAGYRPYYNVVGNVKFNGSDYN